MYSWLFRASDFRSCRFHTPHLRPETAPNCGIKTSPYALNPEPQTMPSCVDLALACVKSIATFLVLWSLALGFGCLFCVVQKLSGVARSSSRVVLTTGQLGSDWGGGGGGGGGGGFRGGGGGFKRGGFRI